MNNYKITGLGTPTNNTDATNKKFVDDKKCTFKDGTTSISTVDLRDMGLDGSLELYNNITFDGGAFCRDLTSSSTGKAIVNNGRNGRNGTTNYPSNPFTSVISYVTICNKKGTSGGTRDSYKSYRTLQGPLDKR